MTSDGDDAATPVVADSSPPADVGGKGDDAGRGLAEFVEEFGIGLEASGLPRAAGRMLAWLMVCEPPEQSAEELATALQASAGGVSTNVRLLMHYRFVERVGKAGDRRSYYRTTPHVWSESMAAQEQTTAALRAYADRGLQVLAGADPVRLQRLAEMRDYLTFMEREMPALRRRYDDERGPGR